MTRLYQTLLIAFMLLVALVVPVHAQVQTPTPQPLVILVRDGTGQPLAGVALDILKMGPPAEAFTQCVTGLDGRCALDLPPGPYLVRFVGSWQGKAFIDPAQQNGGSLSEDAGLSGFGLNLSPSYQTQVVAFVVGQRAGRLVPLWDTSRDPDAPPQPFIPPGSSSQAPLDLGALSPATAQVVFSELPEGGPTPTGTPSAPLEVDAASDEPGQPGLTTGLVLVLGSLLLLGGVYLLRRLRQPGRA